MKIFGWLLLAAIGLAGVVLFIRRKRAKTPCEKVAQVTEKGVDAYYGTKTASIVDDKKDAQACQLLQQFATGVATGTASFLGSHTTVKTALLAQTNPVNVVGDITKGNGGAALDDSINLLTGRDVIESLNIGGEGTRVENLSCDQLKTMTTTPAGIAGAKFLGLYEKAVAEYAKRCNLHLPTISGGIAAAAGSSR